MAKTRPRRGSPLHLADAFELFGQGYQIIKRNFEVFMVLFATGAILALWETLGRYVDDEPARDWKSYIVSRGFGGGFDTDAFGGGIMFFISILYGIAYLLLVIAVLRAAQGQKISIGGLWRELIDRWLWLKMIATFIVLSVAIVIGLLLLIIPGLILIWRLFFVPYVLIDQKTTIEEAFRRSWRMTRGFAGPIYAVILVTLLLSLTNVLPILGPLVGFVLVSIYSVAPALRYQELKKISSAS